jgi:hypothetical protein
MYGLGCARPQRATMNEAGSLTTTANESNQLSLSTLMASLYHCGPSRVTLFRRGHVEVSLDEMTDSQPERLRHRIVLGDDHTTRELKALRNRSRRNQQIAVFELYSPVEFELDRRLAEAENIGIGFTVPSLKIAPNAPRFGTIGCRIGVTSLVESKE